MRKTARMDFEEWADFNDLSLRRPQDVADAIKQFGFDWVSGEDDAKDVDLRDVARHVDEEVWDLVQYEASQLLLNKLGRYVKFASDRNDVREHVACRLVAMAEAIAAQEDEDEDDPRFIEKLRSLKKVLGRLGSKKRRKLGQYGIGAIKGTGTVEDLVDALMKVAQG